jgi:hypothetical protein
LHDLLAAVVLLDQVGTPFGTEASLLGDLRTEVDASGRQFFSELERFDL